MYETSLLPPTDVDVDFVTANTVTGNVDFVIFNVTADRCRRYIDFVTAHRCRKLILCYCPQVKDTLILSLPTGVGSVHLVTADRYRC